MKITLAEPSLVVLVGASGSGKSTFAARHFASTEVISSDECRGLVSDDPNDMGATDAAFEVLHLIAAKRLEAGKLTVVDATSVEFRARQPLLELAWASRVPPAAIVFDLPEQLCLERNASRPDRQVGAQVIRRQSSDLRRSLNGLEREGFRPVYVLRTPDEVDAVEIEREGRPPIGGTRKGPWRASS
jgi:protein phosphatase